MSQNTSRDASHVSFNNSNGLDNLDENMEVETEAAITSNNNNNATTTTANNNATTTTANNNATTTTAILNISNDKLKKKIRTLLLLLRLEPHPVIK
jgi:hypothetical protein